MINCCGVKIELATKVEQKAVTSVKLALEENRIDGIPKKAKYS